MVYTLIRQEIKIRRGINISKWWPKSTLVLYYASSRDQLQEEFWLVKKVSGDICMEFGSQTMVPPYISSELRSKNKTWWHNSKSWYKYLGLQLLLGISEINFRNRTQKKVLSRVNKICKSNINSRDKITAINSWAIPVAAYTFGVLSGQTPLFKLLTEK